MIFEWGFGAKLGFLRDALVHENRGRWDLKVKNAKINNMLGDVRLKCGN